MEATKSLREILTTYDVLKTFELLPEVEQEKFSTWIERATDDDARWRRIEAFVLALRVGPLQPVDPKGRSETVG